MNGRGGGSKEGGDGAAKRSNPLLEDGVGGSLSALGPHANSLPKVDEDEVFRLAGEGDVQGLEKLLRKSSILARCRRQGSTPLHKAAAAGSIECMTLLLQVRCLATLNPKP